MIRDLFIHIQIILLFLIVFYSDLSAQPESSQIPHYSCSWPRFVDSSALDVAPGKVYFYLETESLNSNFDSLRNRIDNNTTDQYLAYLINTTDSTISIELQDGAIVMIQEALNSNRKWLPIEYWVPSGCGNSYDRQLILSGKYVTIPVEKHTGDFSTAIRLKLIVGDKILYSEPIKGSIDSNFFYNHPDTVYGLLYTGPPIYLD